MKDKAQFLKRIITTTIIAALVALLAAIGVFAYFNLGGTPSGSDFANFGSYLGGVSATVLGLATSILVLVQLVEINKQLEHQKKVHNIQTEVASLNFSLKRIENILDRELATEIVNGHLNSLKAKDILFTGTYKSNFRQAVINPEEQLKSTFGCIAEEAIYYCMYGIGNCFNLAKQGSTSQSLAYANSINIMWQGIAARLKDWEMENESHNEHRKLMMKEIVAMDDKADVSKVSNTGSNTKTKS